MERAGKAAEVAARMLAEAGRGAPPPEPTPVAPLRRSVEAGFVGVVPPRFRSADLTGAPDRVTEWARNPAGRNLVLVGPVGVGKSWLAAAAAVAAAPDRFIWSSVGSFLDGLRPDAADLDRRRSAAARRTPLLVLDDIGVERVTEWAAEQLDRLIDDRWSSELPVLGTTNLAVGAAGPLVRQVGERLYSRLVGSGAVVVEVSGPDRRRTS